MKNVSIGVLMILVAWSETLLLTKADALAWSSSGSSWSSYGSSGSSSSVSTSSSYSTSSWGSSGTSRDGSTSWSSWSYSDNGSATSETLCRKCHSDLKRFVLLKYETPDKHHLLIDKKIPDNSIAPNDTPGDLYECLTCHSVELVDNAFSMKVTRDCLKCHPINTVTGSPRSNNVHHSTQTARQFGCNICHSVIGWGRR